MSNFEKFSARFANWESKNGVTGWASAKEAWDWLEAHGWKFGYAAVKRSDVEKPWGPDNVRIVAYDEDGKAIDTSLMARRFDDTVSMFTKNLFAASERQIGQLIRRIDSGTFFPLQKNPAGVGNTPEKL